MDINREHNKTREDLERMKKERSNNHKCRDCCWGRFTGIKYICMFPRCLKKLGSFERGRKSGGTNSIRS